RGGRSALGGTDHRLLALAQLRRREALGARERLLALEVAGDARELRLRHLDRVAVDRVEEDLQVRDPAALALARLEAGDPLAALRDGLAQRVELRVEARAHVAGLARAARPARQ